MKKKGLKGFLLLSLLLVGLWGLFLLLKPKPQFTPEVWAKTQWQDRNQLVDSLTENYQLKGMTKDEVKALLGNPDTDGKSAFEYKIKKDFFFDWRVFYLKFSNDKVVEYGVSVPDW